MICIDVGIVLQLVPGLIHVEFFTMVGGGNFVSRFVTQVAKITWVCCSKWCDIWDGILFVLNFSMF